MFILPEILSLIIPFCELNNISKLDIALCDKTIRSYFLKILKIKTLNLSLFFEMESSSHYNFTLWITKRNIKFHSISFGYDNIALINVICKSFDTLKQISLYNPVSRETISLLSNLCKNVTHFRLINNNPLDDIFLYLDLGFIENLEFLELSCCTNFGLVYLQYYTPKLKHIIIRNIQNLNEVIINDFVKIFQDVYIDIPLQCSVETNYLILKTRNFKQFSIISFNENDELIRNTSMLNAMFANSQTLQLIQFYRVTNLKKIIHILYYTNNIKCIHIKSNNVKNLPFIVPLLKQFHIRSLYIKNTTSNINICQSKIISFFQAIIKQKYAFYYLDFTISFNNENNNEFFLNFQVFNKLLQIIHCVVKRRLISNITICGLIICSDFFFKNNNWRNLLYKVLSP